MHTYLYIYIDYLSYIILFFLFKKINFEKTEKLYNKFEIKIYIIYVYNLEKCLLRETGRTINISHQKYNNIFNRLLKTEKKM